MSRRVDIRREEGFALVLVMLLIAVLTILGVTLMELVRSESDRSSKSIKSGTAYQAAEAGVDDYVAKLLDDHLYYDHYVHAGEATRKTSGGTNVSAGATWPGGAWTYPNGKDFFNSAKLASGYEYDLQITPPSSSSPYIKIVSTGRKQGSTTDQRSIETWIRPSSVSDFQMLANADIAYGSTATTRGKIYAGKDSSGVKHNVDHAGTAYENIYAEGDVTGSTTLMNNAKKFDKDTVPDIRSEIKQEVNFNSLVVSLVDVQAASQVGGIYLNNATKDAWKLTFNTNGTVDVRSCTKVGGDDVALTSPNCGSATNYPVPVNGAIYTAQTAIVSGTVDGRVTVASNNNVVVGATIDYELPGDDVLGLVAKNDVIVAYWSPSSLNWRAACLAQSGRWRSYTGTETHSGTMTFTGSVATNLGGYMSMFANRVYNYDTTLAYLQPPWFPTVEGAYTVVLFREVQP